MQTTVQVATPVIPQRLQYRSPRTRAAGIAACLPPKSSTLHDVDPVDTLQRVAVVLYQHLLRCERDKAGLAPLPPVHRAAAALPQVPDLTLPPLDISGDITVPAGGGAALPAVAEAAESLPQPGTSVPAGVNIGVARVASAVDLSAADRSLLFAPQWSREPVSTLDSTAQGSVSTSIRTRDGQPILEAPPRVPGSSTPRLDASPAVGSLPAFALPSPTLSAFSPALGPTGAGQSKGADEEDESHHFHEAQFLRPQFDLSFYRGPVVHIPSFFTIRVRLPPRSLPSPLHADTLAAPSQTMEPAFTLPTVTDIFTFAHYVYGTARLSPECSVVCLIYVERLLSNGACCRVCAPNPPTPHTHTLPPPLLRQRAAAGVQLAPHRPDRPPPGVQDVERPGHLERGAGRCVPAVLPGRHLSHGAGLRVLPALPAVHHRLHLRQVLLRPAGAV